MPSLLKDMQGKIIILFSIVGLALLSSCDPKAKVDSTASAKETSDQLSEMIQKNPEKHGLLFQRAQQNYQAEKYDLAIDDLKKAIAIDSLQPPYYHLLSDVLLDYYRSKEALQTMETAAELFPKRIPTLLKLSEIQLILQQYDPSLLTVARILNIDPDEAEAHFMMGMNFRSIGEIDRAINAFQKTTELDPEFTDAWLIAGDLLESKGLPIAKDYYEAATNIEPDNPTTWHSKAFYLQNHNKELEAIQIYKKINTIDKNYEDAYLNAGILYMTMDSLKAAREQFNIMSKIRPENHLPYYYLGLIDKEEGDIKNARSNLQNAINLNSEFSKAKKALENLNAS